MARNSVSVTRIHRAITLRPAALAALGLGLTGSIASGVPLTWDVTPGDGAAITAGSGTWDLTTSNTVWNNAGANVAWTNSVASPAAPIEAVFAGADGTYAINLAMNPITSDGAAGAGGLRFLNSGYTLSALAPQTLQVGTSGANTNTYLTVASGKSATIGSNVTVWGRQIGQILNIDGGGTLNVTGTNATLASGLNLFNVIGGTTVNVGPGGTMYSGNSQFLVGTSAGSGTLIVNGGTVKSDTVTATHNFILANNTSGTVTGTLTINSGSVIFPAVGDSTGTNGGLRIGPGGASTGTSNGYINLNGGSLEVGRIFEIVAAGTRYSEFNFNGGTLKVRAGIAAASANVYMNTLDHAYVKEGGAVIDTNGQAITIAQALEHGGAAATDGGLVKKGNGSLKLTGVATYTGTTDVQAGTLTIGAANILPDANTVQVSGGTLDVANADTVGNVTVAGNGTISGAAALTGSAYDLRSGTVSATLAGSASATKTTSGTVTLSGTQTYTGPTSVSAGTLNVAGIMASSISVTSGGSIGGEGVTSGNVVLGAGSAITFNPTTTGATDHFRSSGNIDTTGGASSKIFVSGTTGVSAGSTAVVMEGASITSNGVSDFKLGSRGSLSLTSSQLVYTASASESVKWKGGNATNPTFWDVNTTSQNFALGGVDDFYFESDSVTFDDSASSYNVAIQGAQVLPGSVVVDNSANAYTISGVIAGSTALTKSGSNQLTLLGAQAYTGGTTINGGTLRLGDGTSLGTVIGAVTNNGTLEVNAGATNNTLSGDIVGTGNFVKSGAGTTTLTGANTYAGTTTINAGVLQVGAGGTTGAIGAGSIVNNGSLVLARSDSQTFSNAISGTGSLVKQGAGILTINGNSSYTGSTTLSEGHLLVTSDNALGSDAGGTTVVGTRAIGLSGGVTVAEPITGAGVGTTANNIGPFLAQQRGLVQSVSGNNTLNGAITINATGPTRFGVQDGASLTLNGPITVAPGVANVSIVFRTALDGDWVTLGNSNNNWDGATAIFCNAIDPLTGSGVRLTADNGMSQVTTLSGGGPTGGAGNTFDLNGHNQKLGGLTSNGDLHITNRGPTLSTLTLELLADQYSGRADPVRVTTIEDGASPNPLTGANQIALVKRGNFTQTLMGAHTYSGPTTIEAGTLTLANSTTNPVGSLNPLTKVSIASGAKLVFNTGQAQTISGLSGGGTVTGANAANTALTVNIAAGDTNNFSGVLGGTGTNENNLGLIKTGRGTLVLANATSGDQIVSGLVDGLDLQAGKIVFDYGTGTNPSSALVPILDAGFDVNFATGRVRSTTMAAPEAIGFVDSIATSQFIIARTIQGDANLDYAVNFDDLLSLAQNYGGSGGWDKGDFNYDNAINFDDLLVLAQQYGANLPASVGDARFAADWALAQSLVPEPGLALLAAGSGLTLLRRRTR